MGNGRRFGALIALISLIIVGTAHSSSVRSGSAGNITPLTLDARKPVPTSVMMCDADPVGRRVRSRPQEWAFSCTPRSMPYFSDLSWTNWGGATTTGTGQAWIAHVCDDIEDGEVCRSPVPGTVRFSTPRICFGPNGPVRFYTRATVNWNIPVGTPWSTTGGSDSQSYRLRCSAPTWTIPARWNTRMGPVSSRGQGYLEISTAELSFGPARQTPVARPSARGCFTAWPQLGLRLFNPSYDPGRPTCNELMGFWSVDILDRRWQLWNGVRVGTPVAVVRKKAVKQCRPDAGWACHQIVRPSSNQYILAQARSVCSLAIVPTVIARVAKGRVSQITLTGHCE